MPSRWRNDACVFGVLDAVGGAPASLCWSNYAAASGTSPSAMALPMFAFTIMSAVCSVPSGPMRSLVLIPALWRCGSVPRCVIRTGACGTGIPLVSRRITACATHARSVAQLAASHALPPGYHFVCGALTLSPALRRGETVSCCPSDVNVCCLLIASSSVSRAIGHVLVGCPAGGAPNPVDVVTVTAVVVFPSWAGITSDCGQCTLRI